MTGPASLSPPWLGTSTFKMQGGTSLVAVVKNPPANAGDTGFEPWCGKIPHAVERLSTTTEAQVPRARALQQEKPPQ